MSTNFLLVNTKKNVLSLLEACSNFPASCSEHFWLLAFQCSCGLKPQKYSTFASCGGLRVNSCSAATSCATSCMCIFLQAVTVYFGCLSSVVWSFAKIYKRNFKISWSFYKKSIIKLCMNWRLDFKCRQICYLWIFQFINLKVFK